MKVLAVGDIHTKLWIIDAVEKVVDDYDAVVFVGDYADDWDKTPMDTITTWKRLKSLQDTYGLKVIFVKGNHDYAYLMGRNPHSGGYNTVTQLLLDSPDNADLKKWLIDMPFITDVDGVVYSHAGTTIEWDDMNRGWWNDRSPLWVRPDDGLTYVYEDPYTHEKRPQVFGHTPSETCWEVNPHIWCIDTFSTYRDGTPIGDQTVLEIIDAKTFNKIKLETKNDNDNTNGIKV